MAETLLNDQAFADAISRGELLGAKCSACGASSAPPRPICASCGSAELERVELSGTGKLTAFTSISIGPPWMVEQGFDRSNPYCCGVVELDEGPRVVARIDGVDARHPEGIQIGTPVMIKFDGASTPVSKLGLVFVPR